MLWLFNNCKHGAWMPHTASWDKDDTLSGHLSSRYLSSEGRKYSHLGKCAFEKKSNSKDVKWDWPEPHSLHTHRQRGITAQEDMEAAFVRRWNERGLWEGSRSEQSGVKLEISRLRCESERTSFDSWAGDSQSATLCARCRNGKGAIEL